MERMQRRQPDGLFKRTSCSYFLASSEEKATEELKLQLSIARKLGIPVKKWELMKEEAENCGFFRRPFGVIKPGNPGRIQSLYGACSRDS